MTSFVEGNTRILNSKIEQYNRSMRTEEVCRAVSANARAREASDEASLSTVIKAVAKKRKKAVDKKNAAFAAENREIIRESIEKGSSKVRYSYEEYKYNDHNFPIGLAAIALVLTIVCVFLLLNYSQITQYTNSINKLESQKAEYFAEIAELDIMLDKKTDLAAIEKYALDNGMVTSEHIEASHYINMSDSYKIEKSYETEHEFAVSTVMSGVVKLFGEAFN